MMTSKSPDLFSFTVTGLRDIIDRHGSQSTQTADAHNLLSDFINKVNYANCNCFQEKFFSLIRTETPACKKYFFYITVTILIFFEK